MEKIIPYSKEWKTELDRFPKEFIIDLFAELGHSLARRRWENIIEGLNMCLKLGEQGQLNDIKIKEVISMCEGYIAEEKKQPISSAILEYLNTIK